MPDLLDRLRFLRQHSDEYAAAPSIIHEAAEEIERLRSDVKRLENAADALASCVEYWRDADIPCPPALHDQVTDALHEARAALRAPQGTERG